MNNYTALSGEEDHQYTQVGSRAIGGRGYDYKGMRPKYATQDLEQRTESLLEELRKVL